MWLRDVFILWWRNGTDVNLCLLCTGQASFTVYQGHQQQSSFDPSKVTRVMCKLSLTFALYLLCVRLSRSTCVMTVASAVTSLLSDVLPGVKTENQ